MVFRKNLRSLERRWEKISKFLGDLPSEQIFYRNIPLGAPDFEMCKTEIADAVVLNIFLTSGLRMGYTTCPSSNASGR